MPQSFLPYRGTRKSAKNKQIDQFYRKNDRLPFCSWPASAYPAASDGAEPMEATSDGWLPELEDETWGLWVLSALSGRPEALSILLDADPLEGVGPLLLRRSSVSRILASRASSSRFWIVTNCFLQWLLVLCMTRSSRSKVRWGRSLVVVVVVGGELLVVNGIREIVNITIQHKSIVQSGR